MASFAEKTYNQSTDRLFLVYYALPDGIVNQNNWGVTKESLAEHIHSFIGKPAVLKIKDLTNPMDVRQKGNFVHPMVQHGAGLKDLMSYQENYRIGKITDVKLNPAKGYRFDIEITDPKAKSVLSSDSHIDDYPQYVSPLIVTFPHQNPNQDETKLQTWLGAHIAFVDHPAFGFERMDVAGKCLGPEELCTIKLHNASEPQTSANFCVADAMTQLIAGASSIGDSSQVSQNSISNTETIMSTSTNNSNALPVAGTDSNSVRSTTVTENKPLTERVIATTTDTNTILNNRNNSNEQPSPPSVSQNEKSQEGNEKPQQDQKLSIDEAVSQINSLNATVKELVAEKAKTNKFIADLTKKERISTLKTIIPRQLFKSEDKYNEELERVYNWQGMEDKDIAEHYQGKLLGMTAIAPKAASEHTSIDKYAQFRGVPDFHQGATTVDVTENKISSSQVSRNLEYMRKIAGGYN